MIHTYARPILSPTVDHTTSVFSPKASTGAVALLLALVGAANAEVYSYDCDSVPDDAGWTFIQAVCDPQQWTDVGLLFQEVPLCEEFPGFGAQFDYERDIEDLEGLTSWFIEWRVMTTGISEEIPWTAPTALVAASGGGIVYHFTIADDRVRFLRDFDFPTLFFDIEPDMMHTFRVELFGQDLGETYIVYIDGEIIDSGEAEAPLLNPPWQAQVIFRTKAKFAPSVGTWDYIRWGELPIPGSGDITRDGEVDSDDLPFFHECLTTESGSWPGCVWADMDFSGGVDCTDRELFLQVWSDPAGTPCSLACGDCNPADFNHDGQVGPFDLATLLGSWGPCLDCDACLPDLNDDCTVGPADLAMLLANWG